MSTLKKTLLFLTFYFCISNIFVQNAYAILESGDTLSTSNYEVRTFDVSDEESEPRDVTFSNDGKKMFIVGSNGDDVDEYTLSTAFNISTAVFVDSFSVASEDNKPFGVRFNNDGSKMFIAGRTSQKVFEYSLSVNFDVSEADYTGNSFDVSSEVTSIFLGLAFSHDGTMMYVTDGQGATTRSVYQYSLNKSFDLSGGGNLIRSAKTTADIETLTTNELEPNGARTGGYRLGKFSFKQFARPDLDNDYPIVRLGDIHLIHAEASARAAGNWALALPEVNAIRARAGVSALSSITADQFLAERGREMFQEASRRTDLIRFGKWGNSWWEKTNSDSYRTVFPIPTEQLTANSNLKQNSGY